jgi:prepilin-type processing-associated H-X9-DG protein
MLLIDALFRPIHFGLIIGAGNFTVSNVAIGQPLINIVAPNDLATSEGNSGNEPPFDLSATGQRFQQVFEASQFSAIANGGGYVTSIGYRLDGACGQFEGQILPSFQVNLSTTAKGPDALSPMFSQNIGPDDTMVRGPNQLIMVGLCTSSTPQPFNSLFITFGTRFYYNPSAGNLLLDMRNFGAAGNANVLYLDGHNVVGDSTSSILAFNVNSTTAQVVNSFGFVTEFTFQPVPEPSTWALFALGLGGMAFYKTRSRRRTNASD